MVAARDVEWSGRCIDLNADHVTYDNDGKSFSNEAVEKDEILSVAGSECELGQPYPLTGERAQAMLENLNELSCKLATKIEYRGNIGVIELGD